VGAPVLEGVHSFNLEGAYVNFMRLDRDLLAGTGGTGEEE
jgi:hypothetical protein